MNAIIQSEGGDNPMALHVDGLAGSQPLASTAEEAAALARRYIAAGLSVDLGPAQVNSRNLAAFGLTIEQALDPCTNVRTGGAILTAFYAAAVARVGEGQAALLQAISAYNTGSPYRGFSNGYVARVTHIPNLPMPAMIAHLVQRRRPDPYSADTAAFDRVRLHVDID
jgi:type IV secretion system protein VirB1